MDYITQFEFIISDHLDTKTLSSHAYKYLVKTIEIQWKNSISYELEEYLSIANKFVTCLRNENVDEIKKVMQYISKEYQFDYYIDIIILLWCVDDLDEHKSYDFYIHKYSGKLYSMIDEDFMENFFVTCALTREKITIPLHCLGIIWYHHNQDISINFKFITSLIGTNFFTFENDHDECFIFGIYLPSIFEYKLSEVDVLIQLLIKIINDDNINSKIENMNRKIFMEQSKIIKEKYLSQ